jgi:hypothetical protein
MDKFEEFKEFFLEEYKKCFREYLKKKSSILDTNCTDAIWELEILSSKLEIDSGGLEEIRTRILLNLED